MSDKDRMIPVGDLVPCDQEQLYQLARQFRGYIDHLYMHWSAGNYHQAYTGYHICIDNDGQIYLMTNDLTELKPHTWHRNTGGVGIAMLCCAGAEANNGYDADLGDQPPTEKQIEVMAQTIDTLSNALNIPIDADYVMNHYEAAMIDGYGPGSGDPETRWDLWYLPDNAKDNEMVLGGQLLRDKAAWYQRQEG